MFGLFYGFYQYLFNKPEYKVLVLGVDNAGKTAFLEQLKTTYLGIQPFPHDKLMSTVGLNIGKIELHDCKLIFWDLGGQQGLRSIWEKYFEEAHGIIYVIDSVDSEKLEDAKITLERILQHPSVPEIVPLLVLCNKQDISGARSPAEIALLLNLRNLQDDGSSFGRKYHVQGISALRGDGIQSGIEWMTKTLKECARNVKPS
mmetsp:Transcript_12816/g.17671  ORF Transcript_12816/g.17671 Transcript_12816/m.17671 type:complete len:202 (+) Transcript_12816:43-648(+)